MQIKCENISIGYENKPIKENINFSIDKGSYLCIVGENGVGKSTLIKTLLGLIPTVKGRMVMDAGLKSTDIGYLPQQTQIQRDFPASVFEVVISGCLNKVGLRPFYKKHEKELAKSMLEKLGILDLQKKSYSELSGGQQQRVLLARALVATNKILLLDEPTAGLDSNATKEFYKLVSELNKEGITIIMITHNLNETINYATHILSLKRTETEFFTKKEFEERGGLNG